MLDKFIRLKTSEHFLLSVRKYSISLPAMELYGDLSKNARGLLNILLEKIGSGSDMESIVVTGTYHDLGYEDKTYFYRARKELVKIGFISYHEQDHFVNPVYVDYLSRRQRDYLRLKYGIRKERTASFGGTK